MTKTMNENRLLLRDVLYEFSLDEREPNAELLDEYVRRHSEYAEALTEFAIELAVDRLRESCESPVNEAEISQKTSPAVSSAISAFHNRLHELSKEEPAKSAAAVSPSTLNPFINLNRDSFRALAESIHANTVFLLKVRDRLIEPATIPFRFLERLSEQMNVSIQDLKAHFEAPVNVALAGQLYKSEGKPEAPKRQNFADAVRSSDLDEASQKDLLSL
jgi:hypothetical protein